VKAAEEWKADVLLSLHFDARGEATYWSPRENLLCLRNDTEPGFAVLWSDEGKQPLVERRRVLAAALAGRLAAAGFFPYNGVSYGGLYDFDPANPGVFVDRRAPGKRVYMLEGPRLPSAIIETHHALDWNEAQRWEEPRTREAFAAAVAVALEQFRKPASSGALPSEGAGRGGTRPVSTASPALR
jgi:N-acetylmuramoyl-L-alanine amidase